MADDPKSSSSASSKSADPSATSAYNAESQPTDDDDTGKGTLEYHDLFVIDTVGTGSNKYDSLTQAQDVPLYTNVSIYS